MTRKAKAGSWFALAPGDVIDVVAPGFRCTDEALEKGVAFLRELGFSPRVPEALFGDDILCSNDDRVRFRQLKKALEAKDSRAVWCVRAGYGAIRFVDQLKRVNLPRSPKLFIGYSDATIIHHHLNHFRRWPSLHGPLLDRLGSGDVPSDEIDELRAVLMGERREVVFQQLTPLNTRAEKAKSVTGRVYGGNLTVFQSLLGTPYFKAPEGILFFEDVGERGYRVDRMLKQCELAGVFKKVKAVVFGTFTGGQERDGRNLIAPVLKRFAEAQKFPVLIGMNAGHGPYQRPVFFHTPAELRPSRCELIIHTGANL